MVSGKILDKFKKKTHDKWDILFSQKPLSMKRMHLHTHSEDMCYCNAIFAVC